jgi:murein L,D-transpeptidase YafK
MKIFKFIWREKVLPPLENPRIVISKSARRLEIYDGEKLIKIYRIALDFEPIGDKQKRGDGRTPEGEFFVAVKNPQSKYHLSLGLNYPTDVHAARGVNQELITSNEHDRIIGQNRNRKLPTQNTALGGEIYLHGGGTLWDWTEGCVALENRDIAEIFDKISVGARVCIKP